MLQINKKFLEKKIILKRGGGFFPPPRSQFPWGLGRKKFPKEKTVFFKKGKKKKMGNPPLFVPFFPVF